MTSARKLVLAPVTWAEGVPVRVTDAFCVTGALLEAEIMTVTLWLGVNTFGEKLAVVPGGNPLTEGTMS